MTRQIFDYSKSKLGDYEYYGFHLKNGRYHIDTKRLKKLHCDGYFPLELFTTPRNTHYFVPKHKMRKDYAINVLREQLNQLTSDWYKEYKDVIGKIKTPAEVQESVRLEETMYTSCADDLEEIEIDAFLARARREAKYSKVIQSIHLQYLQKIFTEFFRAILLVIKDRGYGNDFDFSYKTFQEYVQKNTKSGPKKVNPLYSLPHYKYFEALNKIDNFLKHNTLSTYNALANNAFERDEEMKRFLSTFVFSEQEAGRPYETGMYAGNWVKIGPEFVDETLNNLQEFAEEFCKLIYQEDAQEASWNSDESLIKILKDNLIDFM